MTSSIVQVGAPVLRGRAAEVGPELMGTTMLDALVERMVEAMRAAPGVGLAAPQIGVPLRVIVLEDREEYIAKVSHEERTERGRQAFPVRTFVNPVLRMIGPERATFVEGCLSVNGFVALVERALEVEVSGLDTFGRAQSWRVRGWPARILQHEVDHLDGTLSIDRMHTRTFSTAENARAQYAGRSTAEIQKVLGPRHSERPRPLDPDER